MICDVCAEREKTWLHGQRAGRPADMTRRLRGLHVCDQAFAGPSPPPPGFVGAVCGWDPVRPRGPSTMVLMLSRSPLAE